MGICFFGMAIFSTVKGMKARAAARVNVVEGEAKVENSASSSETTGKTNKKDSSTKNAGKSKQKALPKNQYKQSRAKRKAAAAAKIAKYKKYDPSKRSPAELATDTDPKQRFGESKADAAARVRDAKAEIEVRMLVDIYEGLGSSPPPFDIEIGRASCRERV